MKIGTIGILLAVSWGGFAVAQVRTPQLLPSDLQWRPLTIDGAPGAS